MLSFQRLDVYQGAIQFLVVALEILSRLPKGHADLAAQLRASAQSTVANIAEGAGRRTRAAPEEVARPGSPPPVSTARPIPLAVSY